MSGCCYGTTGGATWKAVTHAIRPHRLRYCGRSYRN
jgi:hypothetical protein